MEKQPGMVSFVGAGPGDPELLTLKGKRLIEEAALLLYAGSMIPPALLDLASPRASVIDAAPLDLEECHSLMLQFARAGQPVVHLHTGDPAVYSALREQLALLDRDGIPWQVVPGITAASAAAAAAGCSFTVPGATQSLIMTRMPGRTPMPEQEALRHLAKHGTTLAVYLSAMQARAMQEELEQSLQERTRQEENRKELIASMSHDIRTPLTAIRAYVEGLADNVAYTPERRRHYIEVIQKKTEYMSRMIDQLFLFSKIDLGEKALPLQSLELNEIISDIIEENKEGWQYRQALVVWTPSPEALPLLGNRELWQRIITNLVTNSIKYKTEEYVHIDIRSWKKKDTVCLEVADDGPGVPEEALMRLAEPFYRTDKARSRTGDGSGLGLSIVARGMQLMNGTVTFLPVRPHGLCVHMELPFEGDIK